MILVGYYRAEKSKRQTGPQTQHPQSSLGIVQLMQTDADAGRNTAAERLLKRSLSIK